MFKCDNCGTSLDSFALRNGVCIVNGIKYDVSFFECPCCLKAYPVSISVGNFKEKWMELIDAKQDLKDIITMCPSDEKSIVKARDKIEEIVNDLKAMAKKGQKLFELINIK